MKEKEREKEIGIDRLRDKKRREIERDKVREIKREREIER